MRASRRTKDICCSKCNYVTDKRGNLTVHKYTHKRAGAFKCPICKYASKREFWLEIHYLFNPQHSTPNSDDSEEENENEGSTQRVSQRRGYYHRRQESEHEDDVDDNNNQLDINIERNVVRVHAHARAEKDYRTVERLKNYYAGSTGFPAFSDIFQFSLDELIREERACLAQIQKLEREIHQRFTAPTISNEDHSNRSDIVKLESLKKDLILRSSQTIKDILCNPDERSRHREQIAAWKSKKAEQKEVEEQLRAFREELLTAIEIEDELGPLNKSHIPTEMLIMECSILAEMRQEIINLRILAMESRDYLNMTAEVDRIFAAFKDSSVYDLL